MHPNSTLALRIHSAGSPPFGFHPHYGLIAITYVLDGSFDDEDNLSTPGETPQRHINVKGSICKINSVLRYSTPHTLAHHSHHTRHGI